MQKCKLALEKYESGTPHQGAWPGLPTASYKVMLVALARRGRPSLKLCRDQDYC
jgi:hypothetical protein